MGTRPGRASPEAMHMRDRNVGRRRVYAPLREVWDGPEGPGVGALFDLDRTLIADYSAIAFLRERVLSRGMTGSQAVEALAAVVAWSLGRISFRRFVEATTASARGCREVDFAALAERVFERHLADRIYPEARRLVEAHRKMGHTVAIVSSATSYQVAPIARNLSIDLVECTRLGVEGGRLTGEVLAPVCYGAGKARAGQALAREHGFDLGASWFYSDSHEDLPLLERVGRPRPVNANRRLRAWARRQGWPIHDFEAPPSHCRWLPDWWRPFGGQGPAGGAPWLTSTPS